MSGSRRGWRNVDSAVAGLGSRLIAQAMADPFADLFTSSSSDIFRSQTHIRSASSSVHATRGNTPIPPDTPSQSGAGTPTRAYTPQTPSATTNREEDDFGTFVSVPPSLDPLHQPAPFSPLAPASGSKTDPFGALLSPTSLADHPFVVEARQRHEDNERRFETIYSWDIEALTRS